MVNYGLAFRKPFTNLKTLIIGIGIAILTMVFFFVPVLGGILSIVFFATMWGFIFRSSGVGKVKSKENMPEWGDWVNLFITGVLGLIAKFIYMIPALLVFGMGLGVAMSSFAGSAILPSEFTAQFATGEVSEEVIATMFASNWPAFFNALTNAAPILFFVVLLSALGIFLSPMAILNYIKSGKFADAFALKTIVKSCFTGEYFVVWLVAMIVTALLKMIFATALPIGIFLSGIIAYSLLGQVYGEIKK